MDRSALLHTPLRRPWTNVYGLARSLLAFGTLTTLLVHDPELLFRPLGATQINRGDVWLMDGSLFVLLADHLEWARWIAISILGATVVGWRPRLTGVLHWWVTASFAASAMIVDGGDQLAAVLALLLIPITLTDGRRWHWEAPSARSPTTLAKARGLVAVSAWWVIRLQVAVMYLHAFAGKMEVTEWVNGTVIHYWVNHPVFGVPTWMEPVMDPLVETPVGVMLLTWGPLVLEACLAAGLFMRMRYRPWLLAAGLGFHATIAVVHGLFSFFCSAAAALILYLRPYDAPLPLHRVRGALQRMARTARPTEAEPSG